MRALRDGISELQQADLAEATRTVRIGTHTDAERVFEGNLVALRAVVLHPTNYDT